MTAFVTRRLAVLGAFGMFADLRSRPPAQPLTCRFGTVHRLRISNPRYNRVPLGATGQCQNAHKQNSTCLLLMKILQKYSPLIS